MTDPLELLATPTTDEPIAAGLLFVAGAVTAIGGTLLAGHAMREDLQRQERQETER